MTTSKEKEKTAKFAETRPKTIKTSTKYIKERMMAVRARKM